MRASFKNQIITLAAILFSFTQVIASDLEVRFEKSEYNADKKELYIEVQVKNSSYNDVNLAGQNYRFYYDSEVLSLNTDKSSSALSSKTYTSIAFNKHVKGIQADKVNQVSFDDNLGFANFSIDLHDLRNGGMLISKDEWTTVARLTFDLKKENVSYDLVWGRNGATDLYATAFVEMAEWISPTELNKIDITYYGDLSSQDEAKQVIAFDAAIGPNPTSDFINITLENTLEDNSTIIVRDMAGKLVKTSTITQGDIQVTVDLSDVVPASYIVELRDGNSELLSKERVIVAR